MIRNSPLQILGTHPYLPTQDLFQQRGNLPSLSDKLKSMVTAGAMLNAMYFGILSDMLSIDLPQWTLRQETGTVDAYLKTCTSLSAEAIAHAFHVHALTRSAESTVDAHTQSWQWQLRSDNATLVLIPSHSEIFKKRKPLHKRSRNAQFA